MKKKLLLFFTLNLAICSCVKKEKVENLISFSKIPYSPEYNYRDSLAKKIMPNENFQYWQYATYHENYFKDYEILKEGGDISFREKIAYKFTHFKPDGIFQGGHQYIKCNYLPVVQNDSLFFIESEDAFRDFLGKIDNLEEALLLSLTYGYQLSTKPDESNFRKLPGYYELQLVKFHEYPPKSELIKVAIYEDGKIKTQSLAKR